MPDSTPRNILDAQGAPPERGEVAREGMDKMSGSAMDLSEDKVMQLLAQARTQHGHGRGTSTNS